jgi:hypothetical protein
MYAWSAILIAVKSIQMNLCSVTGGFSKIQGLTQSFLCDIVSS